MDPILEFDRVSFYYDTDADRLPTVNNVSFSLPRGQHLAILGANGSGKSTLARLMNGLLLPDIGAVSVAGMDTTDEDSVYEIRRQCGMVFQNPDNQIVESTVALDIAFGPSNLGLDSDEIEHRVNEALALTGLTELRNRAPHELSGGQKQKLAIAGVLAMQPSCIILDEASSMLDPVSREELMRLIIKLRDEEGLSIVQITHYMEEALEADYVLLLSEGSIVRSGVPEEIFSRSDELRELKLDVPPFIEITQKIDRIFCNDGVAAIIDVNEAAEHVSQVLQQALTSKFPKEILQDELLRLEAMNEAGRRRHLVGDQSVIEVNELSYTYDDNPLQKVTALHKLSVEVKQGEILGIVGATGSGKSTFAQHLNGLIRPEEKGKVRVLSLDLSDKKHVRLIRRMVGLLFQYPEDQLFEETVALDLAFGPKAMKFSLEELAENVERAAAITGVSHLMDRSPFELSGGEQRRVAIAGVLALNPEILIMDEPGAGLDPEGRKAILNDLAELAEAGKTVILISHDMDSVARTADCLMIMNEGRVVAIDTPEKIFSADGLLDEAGLGLPTTVEFLNLVSKSGLKVRASAFTAGEALSEILRAYLEMAEGGTNG
ncbi:MAG: energy-coupling factor transporter ATPase [Clostridiaceae bacterium]|jgi:energy-coupling factor transport system ATP-binding protein|nr:energy-coupling factor transporter ATPase [Clostridiaceae bacterium]